jgi:iron complex outermembrane receptor protein
LGAFNNAVTGGQRSVDSKYSPDVERLGRAVTVKVRSRRKAKEGWGARAATRSFGGAAGAPLSIVAVVGALIAQAQLAKAQEVGVAPTPQSPAAPEVGLSEIVVTAERRSESVEKVPYNISVVSPDALAESGSVSTNDLARVVPGLDVVDEGPASRGNRLNFTLRGLRAEDPVSTPESSLTTSSVSTYFGDTPVFFPLVLKDLERVEVLRGPQGTLYGSGAEGGTIRFIPREPSFDRFSGEVNVSGGFTQNANAGNGSIDGVVNIPLSSNLALRVVAGEEHLAGFINGVDRYVLGANGVPVPSVPGELASGPVIGPVQHGTNASNQWFARTTLRYKPVEQVDLSIVYHHQYTHANDVQMTNPNYTGGSFDVSQGLYPNGAFKTRPGGDYDSTDPLAQPFSTTTDLVSGTATVDFGFASLTSVSSYYDTRSVAEDDSTGLYLPSTFNFVSTYSYYPRFTVPTPTDVTQPSFVQEVRLVSSIEHPFSYVLGLFYLEKKDHTLQDQYAPGMQDFVTSVGSSSANPQIGDQIYNWDRRIESIDKAVFGELTYRLTDSWQVTGGFRFFKDEFSIFRTQMEPFLGAIASDGISPPIDLGTTTTNVAQSTTDHIFKANTSYDLAPDMKVYATYSQGFRAGGANGVGTEGVYASLPQFQSYKPDFATNYEVGIKGLALDRSLRYSADAYWINLRNFQFEGYTPSVIAIVYNGSLARSKGIELETDYKATDALNVALAYNYTEATVIQGSTISDLEPFALVTPGTPIGIAQSITAGEPLPGVSKNNVLASANYTVPTTQNATVVLHLDGNYRSSQPASLTVDYHFWEIPSVFMGNARVTYDSGNAWSVGGFVTNFTNALGYSGGQGKQDAPYIYATRIIARPRTFGVTLHYSF